MVGGLHAPRVCADRRHSAWIIGYRLRWRRRFALIGCSQSGLARFPSWGEQSGLHVSTRSTSSVVLWGVRGSLAAN
jgi:hypothetical protein